MRDVQQDMSMAKTVVGQGTSVGYTLPESD